MAGNTLRSLANHSGLGNELYNLAREIDSATLSGYERDIFSAEGKSFCMSIVLGKALQQGGLFSALGGENHSAGARARNAVVTSLSKLLLNYRENQINVNVPTIQQMAAEGNKSVVEDYSYMKPTGRRSVRELAKTLASQAVPGEILAQTPGSASGGESSSRRKKGADGGLVAAGVRKRKANVPKKLVRPEIATEEGQAGVAGGAGCSVIYFPERNVTTGCSLSNCASTDTLLLCMVELAAKVPPSGTRFRLLHVGGTSCAGCAALDKLASDPRFNMSGSVVHKFKFILHYLTVQGSGPCLIDPLKFDWNKDIEMNMDFGSWIDAMHKDVRQRYSVAELIGRG